MIIKFIDMTEHHQLLVELEEKNKFLKEINRTLNANISVNKTSYSRTRNEIMCQKRSMIS